jgi:hypothetical protein
LTEVQGDTKQQLSSIDVSQPYEAMCKAAQRQEIKTSNAALGKDEPQFRVTVVPSTDGQRFAMLVTISHIIADGYTYYEILNLLSFNVPMKVLNPIRKCGFTESLQGALGKQAYDFTMCPGYMCNAAWNMIFGKTPSIQAHFIDKDKVAAIKTREAGKSVPYVSTNDVVTSAFGKLTQTNVLEMAINMRDRCGDFTKDDAGNLEWCVYYRPEDYATPSLIRQSITAKEGRLSRFNTGSSTKLPGFWGAAKKRIAILTNWSSNHSGECFIGDGCTQELHLPIYTQVPLDFGIIFKPTPDTLGLISYSRNIKQDDFHQQSLKGDNIFGKLISDQIFGSSSSSSSSSSS